jgi:hypothetical protein
MKEGRDLAVTLVAATLLLVAVSYLTQCSAAPQRPVPPIGAGAERSGTPPAEVESEREERRRPKSARELDEESTNEERAKIQRVGRALQTIGANPELRKTLGIPP